MHQLPIVAAHGGDQADHRVLRRGKNGLRQMLFCRGIDILACRLLGLSVNGKRRSRPKTATAKPIAISIHVIFMRAPDGINGAMGRATYPMDQVRNLHGWNAPIGMGLHRAGGPGRHERMHLFGWRALLKAWRRCRPGFFGADGALRCGWTAHLAGYSTHARDKRPNWRCHRNSVGSAHGSPCLDRQRPVGGRGHASTPCRPDATAFPECEDVRARCH